MRANIKNIHNSKKKVEVKTAFSARALVTDTFDDMHINSFMQTTTLLININEQIMYVRDRHKKGN